MNGPCPEMQEKIIDHMLGALNRQEDEAIQRHLEKCDRCREYMTSLRQQDETLTALGEEIKVNMVARQERAIQALDTVKSISTRPRRLSQLPPLAVAAMLILGLGIAIGRLMAPKPIDIEQLRADLQSSITASMQPAIQETVLTEISQQLQARETALKTEIVESMREDLRTFATDVVSHSKEVMDQRFNDFVQLIEAARIKDRQRIVQAFEQVELNRRLDRKQIGQGLKSLVALTSETSTMTNN